jgi:hypothetical protein
MSDRRETWLRRLLVRTGRMLLDGLTLTGSMWCGAPGIAACMHREALRDDGDEEIRAEARRGVDEIEMYLATVQPSTRRIERGRRRRHHGDAT